jgi:GTPase SAR1 family protein/uncharacterized protein YnzC (UPF0291/DUF896 family)
MSKISIKVELNSKIICTKKFTLEEYLDSIREKIKDEINNALFLNKDGNEINRENEKRFSLNDIVDNNLLKLKNIEENKDSDINIVLNDNDFCSINCSVNDYLENLRKLLNNSIQDFGFLDEEGNFIDKEDEKDFTIKESLIDNTIKIKSNSTTLESAPVPNINNDTPKENSKNEINNIPEENKNELNISNMSKELIDLVNQISNSKEELKQKCLKIFVENGIDTMNDLLCLTDEDIESFGFQLIFKKKLLEELNKLRPKKDISDIEKSIIKSLFEKDSSIDDLLFTMKIDKNSPQADLVINYYKSLQKPLKPLPKNLTELFVKTTGDVLPCFHYPSKEIPGKRYYTLLVMGETGSGKTTLLDAFVNYLTGMNFEDEWRYKLVNENHIKDRPSGESQTYEITSYFVNYSREDEDTSKEINIRIIDTPGLGDTKGVLQDNAIIKQFEKLFKEIGELDYILVTVKANTTRWTQANQYIYDRIQEVFGKDAIERFMLMCTFSDGQTPLALKVLKNKFIYQDYFCFNNSALYVPSKKAQPNSKFFWKLGISNVKRFFDIILEKNLLPLSLTMSKQVMEYREWLFANVHSSKDRINQAFKLLENSNKLLEAIKQNEKQLNENGKFTYECEEERTRDIPLQNAYQYCGNCGCLCCQICVWPAGKELSQCTYFNGGRNCPMCPGRCKREAHLRADKIKEKYTVTVTKVYEAKKNLFEESQRGLSASEAALEQEIEKMSELGKSILKDMESIKTSLIELDKIALKPRVFTNEEYFKQMIEYEETEKNPGYENRVKGLKMMQEHARQINAISQAEDITHLFPQYNDILKELKNKKPDKKGISCSIF